MRGKKNTPVKLVFLGKVAWQASSFKTSDSVHNFAAQTTLSDTYEQVQDFARRTLGSNLSGF